MAVEYPAIRENDEEIFHELLNAYYREGEDENTPQEEVDAFIRLLFEKVIHHEIEGCFAKEGNAYIGFSLWAMDTGNFAFSEMPGAGTILEIGLIKPSRSSGHGKELVSFIENQLRGKNVKQCYVSAYGPAQQFWTQCGYKENGIIAGNGLPIMVKTIG